jgi:3-dehydroquinate dehydratase
MSDYLLVPAQRGAAPSTTLGHVLDIVRQYAGLPTIATIRSSDEGGGWRGLAAEAKGAGKVLILSFHDFERTPSDEVMLDLLREAKARGAD